MEIIIPPCSSNDRISKDIYSFLFKQGNSIPISLKPSSIQSGGGFYDDFSRFMNSFITPNNTDEKKTSSEQTNNFVETLTKDNTDDDDDKKEKEKEKEKVPSNSILLEFTNKNHTLENIKGTKLYFLISRNGECARWV
jgi:hypothetical protein